MHDPTEQQGTTSTLDAVEKACMETTTSNIACVEASLPSNDHSALPSNEQGDKMTPRLARYWTQFCNFYEEYEFLLLIVLAIALAKAYPPLGTDYLAPKITATWVAVIFIFVLAGLSLRTEEFASAMKEVYFNIYMQLFNFGLVSAAAYGFSRLLIISGALIESLADGMVICACTPMAINMVHILTKNADGDEASAIFNSTFSNIVGIFLSPLLILGYLGTTGDVDLLDVFYKLLVRILLPLVVGQILQKTVKPIVEWMKTYKLLVKKAQIYALVFIVYTVFCKTFANGNGAGIGNVLLMLLFQFLLMIGLTVVAWYSMKRAFPAKPELIAMGIFGATFKTVSVGVPLINAMYEGNENLGLYTLPLLIWHPMQLVVGSIMAPHVQRWVQSTRKRLATDGDDDKSANKTECVVADGAEEVGSEVVEQDLGGMEAGGPAGNREVDE